MDESSKAFAIEETTTAEQLKNIVVERLELKEDPCFALFEKKDGWGRDNNLRLILSLSSKNGVWSRKKNRLI